MALLGQSRRLISLEFEKIARHGCTDSMDQSASVGFCCRGNKNCKMRSLRWNIAGRDEMNSSGGHEIVIGSFIFLDEEGTLKLWA